MSLSIDLDALTPLLPKERAVPAEKRYSKWSWGQVAVQTVLALGTALALSGGITCLADHHFSVGHFNYQNLGDAGAGGLVAAGGVLGILTCAFPWIRVVDDKRVAFEKEVERRMRLTPRSLDPRFVPKENNQYVVLKSEGLGYLQVILKEKGTIYNHYYSLDGQHPRLKNETAQTIPVSNGSYLRFISVENDQHYVKVDGQILPYSDGMSALNGREPLLSNLECLIRLLTFNKFTPI